MNYFYAGNSTDIRYVFKTLSVTYSDSVRSEWGRVTPKNYEPLLKDVNVARAVMPDVKGMGLKDAVYLLENMGLKVKANGKGKVMIQSILAGTPLAKGMTVYVELG